MYKYTNYLLETELNFCLNFSINNHLKKAEEHNICTAVITTKMRIINSPSVNNYYNYFKMFFTCQNEEILNSIFWGSVIEL